ncbi:MAG: (2Fe-2S)-binding protein [Phycisphaeraceae bacterium]|nr:(2Fe-2S)-binding protein [Phycisphaeraceae bacterium]
MPKVMINGRECEFKPGEMIIQVANANGIEIPQYCYHDGLSIVASCRICLAEVWQPNPRNNNALEPIPKLIPTCQTACADGMVVYTDSPKAIANQKAVMEYLLINHPLDCPVCDQSGECFLQDYSYEYGRGVSRFEEAKVKQPKKDLGPHVLLYSDRCIMCTRCVRFTREVTGTGELLVEGRGNQEQIDVFPGKALANELSGNVIDLCPVGALLDKDFLFAQRVWFLKETPSIDGITASGDNIRIDHNDGKVYRVKPRTNMAANKWWISDEVRYGWKFVHSAERLLTPRRRQHGVQVESDWNRAYNDALAGLKRALGGDQRSTDRAPAEQRSVAPSAGGRLGVIVSPMLSCEDAYVLARLALSIDPRAQLAIGPVPVSGQDKTFPPDKADGFKIFAEKAPNARGVKRVLEAVIKGGGASLTKFDELVNQMRGGGIGAAIITGNYPSDWTTEALLSAMTGGGGKKPFTVLLDTLAGRLSDAADIVLPSCTWMEKSGTFVSAREATQAFAQAIPPVGLSKSEGQIALDLAAVFAGHIAPIGRETVAIDPEMAGQVPMAVEVAAPMGAKFDAAAARAEMAGVAGLESFGQVDAPAATNERKTAMPLVEV